MTRADKGGSHVVSPEGRRAQSLARVGHGVYRFLDTGLYLPCSKCPAAEGCELRDESAPSCPALAAAERALRDSILAVPWVTERDRPLVAEYVKTAMVLSLIDRAVGLDGPFVTRVGEEAVRPEPDPETGKAPVGVPWTRNVVRHDLHPLLKLKVGYVAALNRLADSLGLSPRSRHALGVFREDEGAQPASLEGIIGEKTGSADDPPKDGAESAGKEG